MISKATGGNVLKRVRDVKPKQRQKANKMPTKAQGPVGKKPRGRPPKSKQNEEPAKKSAPKKRAKKQTNVEEEEQPVVKKKPVKKIAAKFNIEGAVI